MRPISLLLLLLALTVAGCGRGADQAQADAAYQRGTEAQERKDFDAAIAHFTDAIRLQPGSPGLLVSRADCWLHKRDYEKAEADCNEALRLDPKDVAAHFTRGHARYRQKHHDDAIADYDEALRLGFKDAYLHHNRGACRLAKGEYAKAVADFEQATRLDPKDHPSMHNLAVILATAPDAGVRDGKRALELAGQALDADKTNARYMATFAAAHAVTGDFTEAVRWQERAMEDPAIKTDPRASARREQYRNKIPLYK